MNSYKDKPIQPSQRITNAFLFGFVTRPTRDLCCQRRTGFQNRHWRFPITFFSHSQNKFQILFTKSDDLFSVISSKFI